MSWISGPCDDADDPPIVVVFAHRPEGSDLPEVVESGGVIWVDTGSGPGWTIPVPESAVEHIPGRPGWDCLACGKPWPCDPAREHLAATLDRVQLAMTMWDHLEKAAGDMQRGPVGELFERFIRWTG